MKRKRLSLIKRIFVCFCCTLLLTTNIFLSYNTAVHAKDDFTLNDAIMDICAIILGIGGVIAVPAELSILGFVGIVAGVCGAIDGAINIYDYVTDNGDGTYTIDEEFIQAVIDAAEQLEAQGFTDKNVEQQNSGYLYKYNWTATVSYMYNHPYNLKPQSNKNMYNISTEKTGRVAGLKLITSGTDNNGRSYTDISCSAKDKNGIISGRGKYIGYVDGNLIQQKDNYSSTASYSVTSKDGSQTSDIYSGLVTFGGNFPIFTDQEMMQNYLDTGQGYKNAENYRATPLFRRHSSYSPTYMGGPVTVNRTVINNINTKITEVDADDSLSDDQKIEILQQYIFTGGISPTPTPPPGPSDPDYDNNKDLPAGTDLTATNSWLKKIYLKICQIYANISDSAGKSMSEVVESIENLQKMLKKYLSEITGDLDDIKGQLEEMTEQEFTEKTESFLDDTLDSFSEISEKAQGKFPFSIPNDIRLLISKMSVSPQEDPEQGTYSVQAMTYAADHESDGLISVMDEGGGDAPVLSETGAPIFYIPFVIASAGIDQYVVIDLSGFESISSFCRSLMTIFFILCLFNLTFKVMGLWGDLVD